jgi:hypothetical protein
MGTLASGAMAIGALSSAGDANATCVSAGGWFTVGSGCTTSAPGDFALAIGEGAVATATGGGNLAVSWGVGASATATGKNNTAIAIGNAIDSGGGGTSPEQSLAAMSGRTTAIAGASNVKLDADGRPVDSNNTAIAIGSGAQATAARGNGNYASAVGELSRANAGTGDRNRAIARGVEAQASAGGGDGNTAIAIGNPVPVDDRGTDSTLAAFRRTQPTVAQAGSLGLLNPRAELAEPDQTVTSNNNTAISRGDGTITRAGDGSNNYASATGNRSGASASGGNGNRATVRGNDSFAVAGADILTRSTATRAALEDGDNTGNRNTATVRGNGSVAVAGPGDGSRATVTANDSSARARDGARVTVRRDHVDSPRKATEAQK